MKRTDPDAHPVLVLFRHDLRLADNRALHAAVGTGKPVAAAFVLDDEAPGHRRLGAARRWWLHHSLQALAAALAGYGVSLILRRGEMVTVVDDLVRTTGADLVLWNRRYDLPGIQSDTTLKSALADAGIGAESFDGHLLHEPWTIQTGAGGFYKVFTPFWRAVSTGNEPREPLPEPSEIQAWTGNVHGDDLDRWQLLPKAPDWSSGLGETWTPGEAGARSALDGFLATSLDTYVQGRDRPDGVGTSRLSPHLCHGEITPFQVWHAVRGNDGAGAGVLRRELAWRDYNWHLLFHNPDLATVNFNRAFDRFPWRTPGPEFRAWQKGRTGYPMVDAGMRELWRIGWMHNRVRMVAASFLVKHLLIDWREGERWFWDTLVDADPANNPGNWQWVAGSGADAAPFFRVFNPVLQGEKFDAKGGYVRAFVPELSALPDKSIHRPWAAGAAALADAGIELGINYARPVVEHGAARDRALAAYRSTRAG